MSDISDDYPDHQVSKGEEISIKVSMPQDDGHQSGSRVAFNDSDLKLTWEDGDQLALIGKNSENIIVGKEILNLKSKNDIDAEFTGKTVAGATHYDVYYPAEAVDNKGNITITYDQQVQNGNNNTAHLKKCILLKQTTIPLTTEDILKPNNHIPMQMQNAIIKFDLKNIFISKLCELEWKVEAQNGKTLVKKLGIKNITDDISSTFTGYISIPTFKTTANSITVSLIGKKDDNVQYSPMNYHIDLKKEISYVANNRYTAKIEKGWIYKIYYKSNVNINESFKKDTSLKDKIKKEEYNSATEWGYVDLKQEDDVALRNLRIPSVKKEIEYLDIYGISVVGASSFTGCESLNSVVLHTGVNSIEKNAFSGCKQLTNIKLNDGLTSIGSNAFNGCTKMTSINLPNSLTTIESSAFINSGLTSITIPSGVKSIEKNTFEGCTALKDVTLNEGLITIKSNAFNGCTAMTSIKLPNSLTTIESSAFINSGLTSITIPSKVTSIGSKSFEGCKGLTTITVKSTTPPKIVGSGKKDNLLGFSYPTKINIYVPSVDKYKSAAGWASYKDRIFPIE